MSNIILVVAGRDGQGNKTEILVEQHGMLRITHSDNNSINWFILPGQKKMIISFLNQALSSDTASLDLPGMLQKSLNLYCVRSKKDGKESDEIFRLAATYVWKKIFLLDGFYPRNSLVRLKKAIEGLP